MSQLTTITLAVAASPFALWLLYCLVVMIIRPTNEALQLIMIAGRWFPLRLRSPHPRVAESAKPDEIDTF